MRTLATSQTIGVFLAASAFAQQTDRTLHFTATSSAQSFQQMATVIHAITEIPQASVDTTERSLSLQGTSGQVALAEWLFTNLDKPTSVPQNGAKHEYRVSDTADDVVRLFYLTNPEVPQGVQEIATAVRALSNIRKMFTYNDLRAVVIRGTSEQAALAEFLFAAMDKSAGQSTASSEFRMKEDSDNLVRVFFLPNTKTVQDFQEAVTMVRGITYLRYVFTYNASRAVGVRGTDDRIALAGWLFEDLTKASIPDRRPGPGVHEYRFAPTSDDFVRVFYLASTSTSENVHETAARVRQTFNIRNAFGNSAPSAIVIRDTAQKIALAEKLIQDQAK